MAEAKTQLEPKESSDDKFAYGDAELPGVTLYERLADGTLRETWPHPDPTVTQEELPRR